MNTELLLRVKQHILDEPKRWSFSWAFPSDNSPCGTKACIGGWTQLLSMGAKSYPKNFIADWDVAREALGITYDESKRLFACWPSPYIAVENDVHASAETKAKNAAARIDYFIETGGL